jgi:diguanylate cyclase (GGDEF)-like protein/PAS domain S-box-containing protein
MASRRTGSSTPVQLSWLAGFLGAFALLSWMSTELWRGGSAVSLYSASSGLVVAAVVRARGRWRVAYLVATFAGTVLLRRILGSPVGVGAAFGLGNVIEAMAFAALVAVWPAAVRFDSPRALARFMAATCSATLTGAVVSLPALALVGSDTSFGMSWLTRVLGHLLGMLSVAPLVLLAGKSRMPSRRAALELSAALPALLVAVEVGFDSSRFNPSFPFIPLVLAFFVVIRLGSLGAAVLTPLLVPLSIGQTLLGHGSFAQIADSVSVRGLAVQLYALTAVVGCWLIAAVQTERRTVLSRLAADNADLERRVRDRTEALVRTGGRFKAAFDEAPVGMALASLEREHAGRYLQVNEALCDLTGYPAHKLLGMTFRQLTHPDEQDETPTLLTELGVGCPQENRIVRADGETIWVRVSVSAVAEGDGGVAIVHVQDITASKETQQQLTLRALYDPLTGLANRDLLMDRLQLALRSLRREPGRVAVFYLDLDGFKAINDSLGHEAGDRMLQEVASRLARVLRRQDTLARFGGDEFVAVCPDVGDAASAGRLARRLVKGVGAPLILAGQMLHPQISVGVATTTVPAALPRALLHEADTAMYAAKRLPQRGFDSLDAA